jgi:hypothetical protein
MATDTTPTPPPQLVKRNDAYTGLLAISFLAMAGACVLLYFEYQQYENRNPPAMPKIDVPGTLRPTPTPPKEAPPPKKEPDNPMPDNPMPPKENMGRLPKEPPGDSLVIPIPDVGQGTASVPMIPTLPGEIPNPPSTSLLPVAGEGPGPVKVGVPNLNDIPPLNEIPSIPATPVRNVQVGKIQPNDLPSEPEPIIMPDAKTPVQAPRVSPMNQPNSDEPPIHIPFVPPPAK